MSLVESCTGVGGKVGGPGAEGIGGYKGAAVDTREKGEEAYLDMRNTGLLGPLPSVQSGEGEEPTQEDQIPVRAVLEAWFLEDR